MLCTSWGLYYTTSIRSPQSFKNPRHSQF